VLAPAPPCAGRLQMRLWGTGEAGSGCRPHPSPHHRVGFSLVPFHPLRGTLIRSAGSHTTGTDALSAEEAT
jgi:hypothetical protein